MIQQQLKRRYVVAYDLSEDRERSTVSELLEGYGARVQKSVFEVCLTRKLLRKLTKELRSLDLASGFVMIYRLEDTAAQLSFGLNPPSPEKEHAKFA